MYKLVGAWNVLFTDLYKEVSLIELIISIIYKLDCLAEIQLILFERAGGIQKLQQPYPREGEAIVFSRLYSCLPFLKDWGCQNELDIHVDVRGAQFAHTSDRFK